MIVISLTPRSMALTRHEGIIEQQTQNQKGTCWFCLSCTSCGSNVPLSGSQTVWAGVAPLPLEWSPLDMPLLRFDSRIMGSSSP